MSEERKKILNMLAEGQISVDEAERLLEAIGEGGKISDTKISPARKEETPKYLRVEVNGHEGANGKPEKVNIRVPLQLLRAGLKLKSLLPDHARHKINNALHEKGVNFDLNNIKTESLEELLAALSDLTVDVDGEEGKVHIFCE